MGPLLLAAALAASGAGQESCVERSAPERLVADIQKGLRAPSRAREIADLASEDLLHYFVYEAFARREPGLCRGLSVFHSADPRRPHNEDDLCRASYHELVYVDALVRRAPNRESACVDDAMLGGAARERAEADCRSRGLILDRLGERPTLGQIEGACARITASAPAKAKAKCVPYVRAFFGDDGGCPRAGAMVNARQARSDVVQCRGFAAFARGVRARDPRLCAGLELCQALTGEGRAVAAGYARRVEAALCGPEPAADSLVADLSARRLDPGAVDSRALISRYAYAALAARGEEPCRKLKPLPFKTAQGSWADACRALYFELAFARALATGDPRLPELCEGAVSTDRDFASLSRAQIAELCRGSFAPIPDFCGRLAGLFPAETRARRKRLCSRFLDSLLAGDAARCAESEDAEDAARCRQYALFQRVRAAGDAGRCGDAEICRAFMGQASEVSRDYAKKLLYSARW